MKNKLSSLTCTLLMAVALALIPARCKAMDKGVTYMGEKYLVEVGTIKDLIARMPTATEVHKPAMREQLFQTIKNEVNKQPGIDNPELTSRLWEAIKTPAFNDAPNSWTPAKYKAGIAGQLLNQLKKNTNPSWQKDYPLLKAELAIASMPAQQTKLDEIINDVEASAQEQQKMGNLDDAQELWADALDQGLTVAQDPLQVDPKLPFNQLDVLSRSLEKFTTTFGTSDSKSAQELQKKLQSTFEKVQRLSQLRGNLSPDAQKTIERLSHDIPATIERLKEQTKGSEEPTAPQAQPDAPLEQPQEIAARAPQKSPQEAVSTGTAPAIETTAPKKGGVFGTFKRWAAGGLKSLTTGSTPSNGFEQQAEDLQNSAMSSQNQQDVVEKPTASKASSGSIQSNNAKASSGPRQGQPARAAAAQPTENRVPQEQRTEEEQTSERRNSSQDRRGFEALLTEGR